MSVIDPCAVCPGLYFLPPSSTLKGPGDYFGPTQIIQENIPHPKVS